MRQYPALHSGHHHSLLPMKGGDHFPTEEPKIYIKISPEPQKDRYYVLTQTLIQKTYYLQKRFQNTKI